jgi:hypothetical protein
VRESRFYISSYESPSAGSDSSKVVARAHSNYCLRALGVSILASWWEDALGRNSWLRRALVIDKNDSRAPNIRASVSGSGHLGLR